MVSEKGCRTLGVAIVACLLTSLIGVRTAAADGADLDDGYVRPDKKDLGYIGVEFRQQDADNQIYSWVGTEGRFAADVDCPTQDTCTVLDESIGLVRPIKFAQSFIEKINK